LIGDNWSLIVRTHSDPVSILRAVREQIHIAAPGQPVGPSRTGVRTGEFILRSIGWEKDQVVSTLFALFAGLALVLAAAGLYSVVSYATALRTQEFGIRMALGARKLDVIRLVLIPAGRIVAIGLVAGIGVSLLSNKALSHWTVARVSDPWVLASIAAILLAVAGVATVIPARRAAQGDPVSSLKQ
jgi:ABC-type antimicrobial peptide transport system permease subunit